VTTVLIIVSVLVVAGAVALVALAPKLKGKEKAAAARAREVLGGEDAVRFLDPRVVGFGTDPESAGGLRGMGVLAAGDDRIVFVTWHPQAEHIIERATVTEVVTESAGVEDATKALIRVVYVADDGQATAGFRVKEPVRWLEALGQVPPSPDLSDSSD
jgi:hypothetical protein